MQTFNWTKRVTITSPRPEPGSGCSNRSSAAWWRPRHRACPWRWASARSHSRGTAAPSPLARGRRPAPTAAVSRRSPVAAPCSGRTRRRRVAAGVGRRKRMGGAETGGAAASCGRLRLWRARRLPWSPREQVVGRPRRGVAEAVVKWRGEGFGIGWGFDEGRGRDICCERVGVWHLQWAAR